MTRTKCTNLTLLAILLSATAANADLIPLASNSVIIDNAPFYSVGVEDGIGGGNFALNHPTFIDIPYAIFDMGALTSASSATLGWNFGSLFGGSGPASISLFVGNDADGVITTSDRFMGTLVATNSFSGGEIVNYDVTSLLNSSLLSGQFFAARLEATVAPGSLNSYYGGQFAAPTLDVTTSTVPEPGTLALLGIGLLGMGAARRRKKA